jgi:hypothetical protein
MKFKEFAQNSENQAELQRIWGDTFKSLGVGGLSDEDAAQQSLSKITFGSRNPDRANSTFKGKQAVRKRLENGQIFQRLEKINDPEIQKGVEDARKWLDIQDGPESSNASSTVSNLLQKMFGQKNFQDFIDGDFPRADVAKAQVEPQAPKQADSPMGPSQMQPGPPQSGMMGQQPSTSPMPNNPMPPKPAGAEMGMF